MYASLHGLLLDKTSNTIIIDVNGLGYEVTLPLSTYQKLPSVGSEIFVFTYLRVLEDSHSLYGFAHATERRLFQELIKLNKVGPKMAMSILSLYDYQSLLTIVANKDKKAFEKVPGIGKATAERIVIELHNKQDVLMEQVSLGRNQMKAIAKALPPLHSRSAQMSIPATTVTTKASPAVDTNVPDSTLDGEELPAITSSALLSSELDDNAPITLLEETVMLAKSALINLGLKEQDANKIIKDVYQDGMSLKELIQACLELYKNKSNKVKNK